MFVKYSIRRRIIAHFCAFSLLYSLVFMLFSFNFMYMVEDAFINNELGAEVEYFNRQLKETGKLPIVRRDYFSVHEDASSLPDDLREQYMANPTLTEYFGQQGHYYHLMRLSTKDSEWLLLAQVSERLMVRRFFDDAMMALFVVGLLLMLAACVIAYRLANYTTKPLSDLVSLVDGAQPHKLPDNFAKDYPNNEVGILAHTLELSMVQIKAFVEREQHFTRDASHELRTPIAVVKNAAEILSTQGSLNTQQLTVLGRISRASIEMEQTVNTLLALAREQGFKSTQSGGDVALLPIVEQVVVQQAYLIDNKPIEVEINVSPQAKVPVEQNVLHILLTNLVCNAFRYTEQGIVQVAFNGSCLTVADTGVGVDADIQQSLLDVKVKGQNSTGFGIGLSLVKRLCEHFELDLQIEHLSQGTCVTITLSKA